MELFVVIKDKEGNVLEEIPLSEILKNCNYANKRFLILSGLCIDLEDFKKFLISEGISEETAEKYTAAIITLSKKFNLLDMNENDVLSKWYKRIVKLFKKYIDFKFNVKKDWFRNEESNCNCEIDYDELERFGKFIEELGINKDKTLSLIKKVIRKYGSIENVDMEKLNAWEQWAVRKYKLFKKFEEMVNNKTG